MISYSESFPFHRVEEMGVTVLAEAVDEPRRKVGSNLDKLIIKSESSG